MAPKIIHHDLNQARRRLLPQLLVSTPSGWFADLATSQDGIQTPGVYAECAGKEQGKEETTGTGDELQHVASSSGSATHVDENEDPIITSM